MNIFKSIVDSTLNFWNEATPVSRVGLIILILFCCGAIGWIGYWSSAPSYVTLVSEGDLDKISRVVDELEKKGIAYELGGAGGVLRVDQRSLARARVIADSVGVETEEAASAGSMGSMWLDPSERKNMEVRRKERMLEATIASYEIIDHANVHLNVPIKGPFERTVASPSASVLVSLRPGQKLTSENVLAIASTVSFAIENLVPDRIRITDESGNVYRVPDSESGRVDNQMEYTAQQERKLSLKAQQQLDRFFGFGNSSVQISLNYTFVESNEQSTEYDADGKVAETEDINTKSTTRDQDVALGAAGTTANLNSNSGSNVGTSDIMEKSEELKNSFLVPKTVKSQTNNTPIRNYMTVSVLVNEQAQGVLQDDGARQPDIQSRVEQLVKTAVGFQDESDQITVDFAAFPVLEDLPEEAEPFDWMVVTDILKNVSLAVAALVVLVLGMMTLRHFKARSVPAAALATESSAQRLSQISELAKSNPEVFASVVKAWAGGRQDETSIDETPNQAA